MNPWSAEATLAYKQSVPRATMPEPILNLLFSSATNQVPDSQRSSGLAARGQQASKSTLIGFGCERATVGSNPMVLFL